VGEEQLTQWIREGRANAQTQVRRGDGPFQPLLAYPELSRALGDDGGAALSSEAPMNPAAGSGPVPGGAGGYGAAADGSDTGAAVRQIADPLAQSGFWMKLLSVFIILPGVVYCLTIIGAILGVPLIIAGMNIWKAADNAGNAAESGDAGTMARATGNLRVTFLIAGIFCLIQVLILVAYLVVLLVAAPGILEEIQRQR
jgi:hypothetical protein